MANKTGKQYIEENDLEGAIKRFENSYVRWKTHWFNICKTIIENCKEWSKKYILDPINETICRVDNMIRKTRPKDTSKESHTYLINLYDSEGNWVYTKIGKANNIQQRMNQIRREKYLGGNGRAEVVTYYTLPNDDLAQVLESFMRGYFRKTKDLIPNDRFDPFTPTEEDLAVFKQYYDLTLASA